MRGEGRQFHDLLADRAPTTADLPIPATTPTRKQPPSGWYWVAGILAGAGRRTGLWYR